MGTVHQPYILLDSVINDYLNESEQSVAKYAKVFHIAFRGMEELGIDFFYKVKTVKLPVNSNLTVTLPADYINYTKVGILNDIGEVIPLYYNNNLTNYADLNTNRLSKTQDQDQFWLDWNNSIWFNFWNGWEYVNVYGVPSGEPFIGSFKIDLDNGVILLNETYSKTYVILEYVASPMEGQDYYLPVQFREALIAWIWWKDGNAKSIRSHMELGQRRDWRHEFYNERRNAIARFKPIRMQEGYQASQEQSRLAVKT